MPEAPINPIRFDPIPECVMHWDSQNPLREWLRGLNRGSDDNFSEEDFQYARRTLAGHDLTRWGDRFGDFTTFIARFIRSQRCTERCWDPEMDGYELEPICLTIPEPPLPPLPLPPPPPKPRRSPPRPIPPPEETDQTPPIIPDIPLASFGAEDSGPDTLLSPTPLGDAGVISALSDLPRQLYPGAAIEVQENSKKVEEWYSFDPSRRHHFESGYHRKIGRHFEKLLETFPFKYIVGPHTYLLIFLSDPAGYYPNYNRCQKADKEANKCWEEDPVTGEKKRTGNCDWPH